MSAILFQILSWLVVIFGIINLIRITILLVGSDIYSLTSHLKSRRKKLQFEPSISLVIPAYNEEQSILKCISSVYESDYPREKLEVMVVDDGSKDKTRQLATKYKQDFNLESLTIISQPNLGKAHALNNAIKNYARGDLVMCLDADSYLAKDTLKKAVKYFSNSKVIALASNVKIARSSGILNLIQLFEYTVCHQMKRAHNAYNIEYIIGGIGSTFRRSFLQNIGYYDANTVTEDIDLTMKILREGNKNAKIIYASDTVVYTQGALDISDLIKQRFRWKWGRYQTFAKNRSMFFAKDKNLAVELSWVYLPFAIWSDLAFLFEPVIVAFMLSISYVYRESFTMLSALGVMTFYLVMNILREDTISLKGKLQMVLLAPVMYVLFFALSFVEYFALIKSLLKLPSLGQSLDVGFNGWDHIRRQEYFVSQ